MKFDLVEINKLSPPGLWNLVTLTAFIDTLRGVVEAGIGGSRAVLIYSHMVVRYSREFRLKTRQNLNMRIKAWVMQCPKRITYVRSVIGEAAIKRWRTNQLADYALTKYFGDWKRKFPDGFGGGFEGLHQKQKQALKPTFQKYLRPYNWKPFVLTKIINVERFLYGRSRRNPEMDARQAAYLKLWGVDILDTDCHYPMGAKGAQPRRQRSFKPVEFTPADLVQQAAGNISESISESISGGILKTGENLTEGSGETTLIRLPKPEQNRRQSGTPRDHNTEKPP
jgi:hypothetical protein